MLGPQSYFFLGSHFQSSFSGCGCETRYSSLWEQARPMGHLTSLSLWSLTLQVWPRLPTPLVLCSGASSRSALRPGSHLPLSCDLQWVLSAPPTELDHSMTNQSITWNTQLPHKSLSLLVSSLCSGISKAGTLICGTVSHVSSGQWQSSSNSMKICPVLHMAPTVLTNLANTQRIHAYCKYT